ncbi:hypothetical protein, partial [Moorena sp. SIO3A5]
DLTFTRKTFSGFDIGQSFYFLSFVSTPLRRSQNPILEFFELAPIFCSRLTPLNRFQSPKPFCQLTCSRFSVLVALGMRGH